MDYTQDTTKHIKGKHFSYGDRRELQGILSNKSVRYSLRQLARHFNCAPNTIRNELKRGAHHNTGRYGARRAQNAYEQSHANSIWTENQGVWNAGIKKEDLALENPPVYMTTNDDLYSWEKVTDDIDTFIILQILDNLESSGFYFFTFDSEQIDFLLLDKKISKDELLKNPFKIKDRNLKFPTYLNYDYGGDKIYIFQVKDDKFEKCLLIKPCVEKENTSYAGGILLKIAGILSFNDREVIKKLEIIFEDFRNYLREDSNFRYIDDEIKALSDKEKIELKVMALVLLLSERGYICYLDWKCELDDFAMLSDAMKKVGIDENIYNIEDLNLDEDDDIEIWCEKFNREFAKKDVLVGNIDTNSDSYFIFPITKQKLNQVRELGKKIGGPMSRFSTS